MQPPHLLSLPDGTVDLASGQVQRASGSASLTPTEVELLRYLAARAGRTVSQSELLREVWQYSDRARTRAVTHAVQRLRKKLEIDPKEPVVLLTEYGRGVRLQLPSDATLKPLPAGFHGRRHELGILLRAWEDRVPLVTLVGAGGIGKTRLANELVHQLDDGVECLVIELDQAVSSADLARAVAGALGLTAPSIHAVIDRVGHALAARSRALVVLDNLEQVDDFAPVATWMARSPETMLLCTSRRALGVTGERVMNLAPLEHDDATALLLHHAKRYDPHFQLDDPDGLGEVASLLDHLPLALELAGPRLPLLGPAGLRAALTDRFRVLRSPRALGRHGTMEAAVAWSWERLDEREREVLAATALFRAPTDLEAIARLVPGLDHLELAEVVHGLQAKSLLRQVAGRLTTFESVRDFALATLPADALRRNPHREWAIERSRAHLEAGRRQRTAPDETLRLDLECAGAERGARVAGAVDQATTLAALLDQLRAGRSPEASRLAHLDRALTTARADHPETCELYRARADVRRRSGDYDGALLDIAEAESRARSPEDEARNLVTRGAIHHSLGELETATAHYERAIVALEHLGDAAGLGAAHNNLGLVHDARHGPSAALDHFRAAVAALERTGHQRVYCIARNHLAICLQHQGRLGDARSHARASLARAEELGLIAAAARAEITLGNIALTDDDPTSAGPHYAAAAAHAARCGDPTTAALAQLNAASAAMATGALDEADDRVTRVLDTGPVGLHPLAYANRGVLRRLQGRPAEARLALGLALDTGGSEPWTVHCRAHLAAVLADLDALVEAERELVLAREHAAAADLGEVPVCEFAAGHLALARARAGLAWDRAAAEALIAAGAPTDPAARLLRQALGAHREG